MDRSRDLLPALRLAARATAKMALEYGRLLHAMNLPADDLTLVQSALRGDPTSLRDLTERLQCVPRILSARNARAGRPLGGDEVVDAAHEVIARVWSQLGEYRGQAALESWVYRFCEFELLNAVRRKRRGPRLIDTEPVVEPEPTRDQVDTEQVYRSLDRLPPDEGVAVQLRHFSGLTFEEIAAREAAPVATIKSRYYRALEKLRFWLAPLAGGGE